MKTQTKRKPKMYSAEALRGRIAEWCVAHGGRETRGSAFNSIYGGVFGGSYEVPTPIGTWTVHLPDDSQGNLLSINTRFEDVKAGRKYFGVETLGHQFNPYSGKWNHNLSYGVSPLNPSAKLRADDSLADSIYENFTRAAERMLKGEQS